VANLAQADGTWSALDSRSLYAHARTAGFLYQAARRDQLTQSLSVQWEPIRNGMAEINGIDPTILRHFSRRRMEIEEHLHQLGRRSRRAAEIAALHTRRTKSHNVPVDHLRADWQARAAEHGLGRDQIAQVLHRPLAEHLDRAALARLAERAAGPDGVTRKVSTLIVATPSATGPPHTAPALRSPRSNSSPTPGFAPTPSSPSGPTTRAEHAPATRPLPCSTLSAS
jgi:hypothetical protein